MHALRLRGSLILLATVMFLAVPAVASDPIGIYAVIDRVVLEPNDANPTAIQIWGVFALSDGRNGDNYRPAERGYLYYAIDRGKERICKAEWADFRAIAGTGQPIGFAGRFTPLGHVRRPSEAPASPETYPVGQVGLVKVLNLHLGPAVERQLMRVPAPLAPADGGRVQPGQVRLVARSVADRTVQYVFEIEGGASERETSSPIEAGKGETAWSPRLRIRPGQQYTWRVWVVNGSWRGPAAAASFRGE